MWWKRVLSFLFAVLASVVGAMAFQYRDIFTTAATVPLQTVLLIGIPSAFVLLGLVGATLILYSRLASQRPRLVVLLSAFERKTFFSEILESILLESAFRDFDVVVKVPKRDYSAMDQQVHFQEVVSQRRSFAGGIVVPIEPQSREPEILEFAKSFGRPLVFLDVAPPRNFESYSKNLRTVCFDNAGGGQMAAEAMIKLMRRDAVPRPRVLVICGNIQTDRQVAFKMTFETAFPDSIVVEPEGLFRREEARRLATQHFRAAEQDADPFSGVFCTNDEMALGVLEALETLGLKKEPYIIGFDGIGEAIANIERSNMFVDTIVQDRIELGGQAVATLVDLIRGEGDSKDYLQRPRLYSRGGSWSQSPPD